MTTHPLPDVTADAPAVLRGGVLVWREERRLVVVGAGEPRTIALEEPVTHHTLSVGGRYLLARSADGRRATVWNTSTGERLLALESESKLQQQLRASLGELAGEPVAYVYDHGPRRLVLRSLVDGGERAWWSTSGYTGVKVESVTAIELGWVGTLCHRDGEQYDSVVVTRASADPVVLQRGLAERGHAQVWGHRVAVGPAGPGQVVLYRDPEWEPDDEPEPAEALVGFVIHDLESASVVQRLEHAAHVANGAAVAADAARVVVAVAGGVRIVDRATGEAAEVTAIAFDPYRLESARVVEGRVQIASV